MSTEGLELLQWLLIVVVGGLTYEPLGRFFDQISGYGTLWSNICVYLVTALMIMLLFSMFRHSAQKRLSASDLFGRWEYYCGMVAGALKAACMLLAVLAVLNARLYSAAEVAAQAKAQTDLLGGVYCPTPGMVQRSVFQQSVAGQFVHKHLAQWLLQSNPSAPPPRETLRQRREREVDAVMQPKP
jgi:hypothetical protein